MPTAQARGVAGGVPDRPRDGQWRRRRLATAHLYVCTDRRVRQGDLQDFLDAILGAGVDLVQLRDKEACDAELRSAALLFRAAAHHHGALFIVNDDPELAEAVDADGVHVGQDDVAPAQARTVVGANRLVGRSTHAPAEIDRALGEDCDYFAVGPVHATPTKAGRAPVGVAPVRHAAAVADRPWFVTGAMSVATAPEVLAAGATRVVVVRAITDAPDPAAAARAIRALLS